MPQSSSQSILPSVTAVTVTNCIIIAHGPCKCIDSQFNPCSSGVLLDLLSPQPSTGLDGLATSTVLVSKADTSEGGTASQHTPTKLTQAGAEADGDWQVL